MYVNPLYWSVTSQTTSSSRQKYVFLFISLKISSSEMYFSYTRGVTNKPYTCRPQRSCEGYVFTGMCLSTRGSTWPGATPGSYPPPPRPGTHPPGRYTPRDQVHPPGRYTPQDQVPPRQVHSPGQVHPSPEIRPLLRTERILLECILVLDRTLHSKQISGTSSPNNQNWQSLTCNKLRFSPIIKLTHMCPLSN